MKKCALLFLMGLPQIAVAQDEPLPKTPVAEQPANQGQQPKAADLIVDKLGMKFGVWSSKIRRRMISTRTPWGFSLRKVHKGSLARAAGLKRSTVVLEVNGVPFRQIEELAAVLREAKPGDTIKLKCSRWRTQAERGPHRGSWIEFDAELKLPGQPEKAEPDAGKKAGKKNEKNRILV